MRRGDVYLVDLDPARSGEANKVRPAIVVSNDGANRMAERTSRGVITVVPLTSNVERIYPFQILVVAGDGGLSADSKAQAEQVRSVAYDRLRRHIGTVKSDTLRQLDAALRLHLAL